ncbi:hypothetical protein EJB05_56300, partial [Eragrostis curvula]
MKNNARLEQLGIPSLASMLSKQFGNSTKKNQKNTNCEGSESEYDPDQDITGEGDEEENTAKNTTRASKKHTNKRAADMPPAGMKTRQKRVLPARPTTRTTRSKKSLTVQHEEGSTGFSTGDGPHQDAQSAQQDEEGLVHAEESEAGGGVGCNRGINMGKGLQKMSRARRGKLVVVIPKGKLSPVSPLVAAKFATECNIAVRNHVPVLRHWKEYKPVHLELFMGKLRAKFEMDKNDEHVQKACTEMMKKAVRQQRYRLKQKYFDPVPLNMVSKTSPVNSMTTEQWTDLVEFWKNPIKMATCEKNKANRAEVKFHQTTGSRSYMVHCENLEEKSEDEDPNAFDLFKECHYSKKKKGYTPAVQSAIDEMEQKIAETAEVEDHVAVAEVVADVLATHSNKNKFLQNVGIKDVQPRTTVRNLQQELTEEKRANADLRLVVTSQRDNIELLQEQLHQAEQARLKDKEEMQKKQADTDAKLQLLLSNLPSA